MRFVFCLLLSLLLSVPAFARSSLENDGAKEILVTLDNGLSVYIIRDARFPLVCTRLYVYTGSSHESEEQAGISHVLEHMVFKGTETRPKGKIAQEVESLGGYLNAATSFDRTWYITDIPKAHWKVGIDVVYDMAFRAKLEEAELTPEKDVIVSELQGGEDSPEHKLFEEMQTAALKNSPYGRPIIGFEKNIRAVTHESLKSYRDYWYQPQNMGLLVLGDINPAQVLEYITKVFGSLHNTHVLPALPTVDLRTAPAKEKVLVKRGPWKKVYLGFAFPAPSLKDLRSVDLDALCHILGGDATSLFYRRYKYDQQLVDSISVDNMSLKRAGLLAVSVQLDQDKVEPFFEAFTKDMAALSSEQFTEDAIGRAVFNLEDSLNKVGETLPGLASWKSTVQFVLGGPDGERNIREHLAVIDKPLLEKTLRAWFDPSMLRVRVLAPESAKLPDFSAILARNWPGTEGVADKKSVFMTGEREVLTLPNKCSLILIPDTHAPYLSISMARPGGNALLAPSKQGLAHLVGALLTDGCGDMSAQEMEAYLSSRAISMDVTPGRQVFSITLNGPSRFAFDMYSLLTSALVSPRFEQQEIAREVHFMKAALRERADQPMSYLFTKIQALLYPDHPYGFDELGSDAILDSLTREDVQKFWKEQSAQPWVITVAGSFNREATLSFAQKLAQMQPEASFSLMPPVFGKQKELSLSLPGRNQAHLVTIFPTVPITHPDAPALLVLSRVLSGQSGLLFSSMRDKEGLGYTVTAFMRSLPQSGSFFFYIGTVPEKIKQAREGFLRVIDDITTNERPQHELDAAVNRLLGEYIRSNQSLRARSGEASQNAILGMPLDFRLKLIEKAKQVTPATLKAVAQKYCKGVSPYTVTLLP
ncbi:MAG: insulinase family protein [Desulfovibrionaceae bacterium]|nr:insulinase family protein [Desulfovibrionaceae bacterium]